LERAGVNICLGTDSMATVRKHAELVLDLFAEMRELVSHAPGLAPEQAMRMATVNGARALGCQGKAGALLVGGWADAVAVPFRGGIEEVAEAVVHHVGDVSASLIDGNWAMEPQV
jgi:5-methylthioadenosine/S-adenosylhomocysteine deaminase